MDSSTLRETDNRNFQDLIIYYEARIEMLLNKIFQLEEELRDRKGSSDE